MCREAIVAEFGADEDRGTAHARARSWIYTTESGGRR